MPIVTVRMFPGRDAVMKEFIARALTDVIAEVGGTSRDGVNVIFDDVAREEWAIGPRLASARPASAKPYDGPALTTVSRIHVKPDRHDDYLRWRKESVYAFMASHEGFLASTLLTVPGEEDQYVIINKWASEEARDSYLANPRETELRGEAKEFVSQLATDILEGSVVDVFHRRPADGSATKEGD